MAVKPIPDGYHSVTPYLVVKDANAQIEFMRRAFDAQEMFRLPMPDGAIGHAEVKVGDSVVMIADASTSDDGLATTSMIVLYVEDCDKVFRAALEAGATSINEPENQFYGDRRATVRDAMGNTWSIHTHVEDVSDQEMAERAQKWAESGA